MALALGTFMQVLDTTIANVSLTTIAGNLGVSTDSSTWVITAFAVANGVTVPLTGWLMRRFGVVRTFVTAVLAFTFASFLCGIAWSLPSLIVFRIIQGAVSGPMIPGSQALLLAVFPPEKRGTALAIWSMTTLVGPVAGPILGGYISDNYHWGWIFLINVPVGLLTAAITWRALKAHDTPTMKIPLDLVGIALLIFWVGALQTVLDLGKNDDWFHSTFITVAAILSGIGFFAWLIWELTDARPAVDLKLFKGRNFSLGTIALCLGYAVFFGNTLLLPLWLQQQLGYTATWAGLVAAPSGIVAVFCTPFAARISSKVDARWMATFSFIAFAASYFMRAGYTMQADYYHFMLPMAVQGMGMSTFFVAMVTISLDGVPPDKVPSATGISNFARITAGSFAASLVTTIWDRREALHQSRLADIHTPFAQGYRIATEGLHGLGLNELQAAAAITRQMVGQAYLLSSVDIFAASAWLSLAMVPLVWLSRRPSAPSGPVAAD
ncbi:DHA2 family efflux MFS transporter permease subunit [Sphingomonas sp. XMGL2]|uniref:DHA2 family efflux MFS transporter permease subunit n=1 Tax=Sphingomonas quercus TaxID=2842451 RepID=A0ABS6BHK7_9SPHN|nr:DHA2 family efflux MFS transporter permease subunit [Sphingomonas quercus]